MSENFEVEVTVKFHWKQPQKDKKTKANNNQILIYLLGVNRGLDQ